MPDPAACVILVLENAEGCVVLGANRVENKQINFRVNKQEFQRLEQLANHVSMSVPALCKAKAQGTNLKSPKINKEGALQIASELRKIGVNINQIAKHLNCGNSVSNQQLTSLEKELHEIWQLFNSAIQK